MGRNISFTNRQKLTGPIEEKTHESLTFVHLPDITEKRRERVNNDVYMPVLAVLLEGILMLQTKLPHNSKAVFSTGVIMF